MARIECTICSAGVIAIVLDDDDEVEMLLCPRCGRREWRQRNDPVELRQALDALHERATRQPAHREPARSA